MTAWACTERPLLQKTQSLRLALEQSPEEAVQSAGLQTLWALPALVVAVAAQQLGPRVALVRPVAGIHILPARELEAKAAAAVAAASAVVAVAEWPMQRALQCC